MKSGLTTTERLDLILYYTDWQDEKSKKDVWDRIRSSVLNEGISENFAKRRIGFFWNLYR